MTSSWFILSTLKGKVTLFRLKVFQYILFHSVQQIAQTVTQILVTQVKTVDDTDGTVRNDNDAGENTPTRTVFCSQQIHNSKTTTKRYILTENQLQY